jgi:hypothetical protein
VGVAKLLFFVCIVVQIKNDRGFYKLAAELLIPVMNKSLKLAVGPTIALLKNKIPPGGEK